jgi:hypothetical protein
LRAARRHDSDSDSEGSDPRTVVRRRRRLLLDPGEAPVVPVYSGKVQPGPGRASTEGQGLGPRRWGGGEGCRGLDLTLGGWWR